MVGFLVTRLLDSCDDVLENGPRPVGVGAMGVVDDALHVRSRYQHGPTVDGVLHVGPHQCLQANDVLLTALVVASRVPDCAHEGWPISGSNVAILCLVPGKGDAGVRVHFAAAGDHHSASKFNRPFCEELRRQPER